MIFNDSAVGKSNLIHFCSLQISPSKFIQEMSLTTEERQKKQILLPRKSKAKNLNASSTCFVPTPNIVIFQSFDARGEYTVPLQVRNSNKVNY